MNIDELKKYKNRNDIRMDELLSIANYFIDMIVPDQPSERVSRKLTDRNIRYYIQQKLVDRPVGKDGLAALYGYRHLLQLIAVKRLQTSYLPVKKIAELIKGKTDAELLNIAVSSEFVNKNRPENPALSFLDSIATSKNSDQEQLKEKVSSFSVSSKDLPEKKDVLSCPGNPFRPRTSSWDRYELEDGIEIHIRRDKKKKLIKTTFARSLNDFLQSL
ncbi:conserved hypothetical protein [Desulfamplus magnetovallimortis]|uniref:HTH merR-type domain-containing protein n=1 Tax=Desulfamplus magnetovallimortis TaxID=1246637 RepID=A0A1W1H5A4_9BACT|nr:MerR family transcriptional regulator [Desulfamplus magnetovallimortis]SLM27555.1 conserved hypothetical protein [Desulfamplus magnetovallimortis]